MGLNFPRPEVSRASSEYKLLANLRQGTNEYVLLRGMDLSFDDSAIAAYHYRSYAHWCNTLRSQPRYDHYLDRYCDVLGQLYYDLSEGYRSVACDLDASIQDQDIYNPGLVLWDKQFGQTVHLPLLLFQHNPRELAKVFQSQSSLGERESEMTKIQAVIDILPGLVEDPWKRDIFHNQLCYLYAFSRRGPGNYSPVPAGVRNARRAGKRARRRQQRPTLRCPPPRRACRKTPTTAGSALVTFR